MTFLSLILLTSPLLAEPGVEALVDKVVELRKQRSDIEKQEAQTLAEIRARLEALERRLNQLGPDPPVPKPPDPPAPADPLSQTLRNAYALDTGANKAEQVKILAELYKQAAALADSHDVLTTADLKARIDGAAAALGLDGSGVIGVRRAIAAELLRVLGPTDPPKPLTNELRQAAAQLFNRIGVALRGIT